MPKVVNLLALKQGLLKTDVFFNQKQTKGRKNILHAEKKNHVLLLQEYMDSWCKSTRTLGARVHGLLNQEHKDFYRKRTCKQKRFDQIFYI